MNHGSVSTAYEVLSLVPHHVMLFAMPWYNFSKITIMPDFTPTPYMLEKHADKGKSPW
eukprot:CAMPEP_0185579850 /NCGR_PEP_ID=MMETSP0434-20130131/15447_1 /TAXON_ID=626734 ORGANISM="Favella taraikaensis, Strain Fe Narragansett Bay" /NCGR_SAMPLE_ID=MMETSP0434 /ASSEMBLY_ACC=CAM_ASM_000379 /LENGTH=57 /DNA_ID=CAMNT_0028197955 /DNA_START=934 /DNA_END=1107 /DNA_ORIENTATION=+